MQHRLLPIRLDPAKPDNRCISTNNCLLSARLVRSASPPVATAWRECSNAFLRTAALAFNEFTKDPAGGRESAGRACLGVGAVGIGREAGAEVVGDAAAAGGPQKGRVRAEIGHARLCRRVPAAHAGHQAVRGVQRLRIPALDQDRL